MTKKKEDEFIELLNEQEICELHEAFNIFDIESNGSIETNNLVRLMNALKQYPSKEEIELLRQSAQPFVQTKRCGNKISLTLKPNAVCYFEIKAAPIKSDRGYTYARLY